MKKILLIALMSLFTLNINATNDTIPKISPDSLQLTYKQVYTDIKSGISAIADGLKVGSEHVYEVLVKQQLVNAIVFTIIILFGIVLFIYGLTCFESKDRFKRDFNWVRKEGYQETIKEYYNVEDRWKESHVNKTTITIVLSIVLLMVGLKNISIIIGGFVNPEYGAIHEILSIIK